MTHTHVPMEKKPTKVSVSRFPEGVAGIQENYVISSPSQRGTGIKVDSLLFGVEFKKNASNGISTMFKR